jgi:hypothetical protein
MVGPAASETPRIFDPVTSFYVWGPTRGEVNRLALRIAQGLDSRFAWVEVSDGATVGVSDDVPAGGIGAPTHAFRPPAGVSPDRMWTYLRPNGQHRAAEELQGFLKMSEPIQQAIGQLLERDGPRVLVVANLERLQELFCSEVAGPHPFIEWLNAHEITLVASSTGEPLREGVHFDYLVTQPDATRAVARPPVIAICQQGDRNPSFVEEIFHPNEVVCLSGLSPSRPPPPVTVPPSAMR